MPVSILHVHSTFSLGGKEARAVALMNAFGDAARHTILSSMPGALGARSAIAPGIDVDFPQNAPALTGPPSVARYRDLADFMARFDLILTYNWGAMDAVTVRRLFARDMPPLVHHEDGFNADEAGRLKPQRNLMRRIMLPAATALVVPSQTLEKIALTTWKQPRARVHRIANGIDTAAYAKRPKPNAIPGFRKRPGEVVIGTVAGLRAVKNIPRLVRAALAIPKTRLVVVGEGPERDLILSAAHAMGAADRLFLAGFLPDPHRYIGAFDIFALSSDSEQFPIALVEAMAAGLPVVATDVGDVRAIVAPSSTPFVVPPVDLLLETALRQLVADARLRATLGADNRALAASTYDRRDMISAYARLYAHALGDKGAQFAAKAL